MSRTTILSALALLGLVSACASANQVTTPFTTPFGGPGFTWFASGPLATSNHIWIAGDFWSQTVTGTGLASVNDLALNLSYDDNGISAGDELDMNVLLNGNMVGSFVIPSGATGPESFDFNGFGSVAGPDYTIQLLAINTIPLHDGSVSLLADGRTSTATLTGAAPTAVPEPGSIALLIGMGLSGAGFLLRRHRK